MKRSEYFSTTLKNLGLLSFLSFEYQRRVKRRDPFRLSSKKLRFPVSVRPGTSDLFVFYQIFVFDEYRCVSGLRSPGLIVDLGANVGYSSAYFLSRFVDCSVIAVEPDPANFAELEKNVAPYSDRITTIQAAVWPRQERIDLKQPGKGGEWGISVTPSAHGTVKTITIPEILKASGRDRISLLKIDIEGAETELFSADTNWLDRTDNIVIELHGAEAEKAFHSKIDRSRFALSRCDELTVCLSSDFNLQELR